MDKARLKLVLATAGDLAPRRAGQETASFSSRPTRGSPRSRSSRSPPAASSRGSSSPSDRSARAGASAAARSSSTRSTPASAAASRRSWAGSCASWRPETRSSASRTCRRSRRSRTGTSWRKRREVKGRTVAAVRRALRPAARGGDRADARGREGARHGAEARGDSSGRGGEVARARRPLLPLDALSRHRSEPGQEHIRAFSIAFVGVGAVGRRGGGGGAAGRRRRDSRSSTGTLSRNPTSRGSSSSTPRTRRESRPRPTPRRSAWRRSIRGGRCRGHRGGPRSPQRPRSPGRPRARLRRLGQLRDAAARLGRGAVARTAVDLCRVRRRGRPRRGLGAGRDALPALLSRGASAGRLGPDLRHGGRRADAAAAGRLDRHDGGPAPGGGSRALAAASCRLEVWDGGFRSRRLFADARPRATCPVCAGARFPALEGEGASEVVKLCGRNSVQVAPAAPRAAGLRLARGAARPGGRDAAVAAAALGGRRGRQPDGLLGRPLRRAGHGRSGPGARRSTSGTSGGEPMRRISIADLNASAEELTNLRALLAGGGVAGDPDGDLLRLRRQPEERGGRRAHLRGQGPGRREGLSRSSSPHATSSGTSVWPRPRPLLDRFFAIWPAPLTVVLPLERADRRLARRCRRSPSGCPACARSSCCSSRSGP